jgi:hypothetical protein
MKNNFTKEEAEKLKEFTHVWVIDTMPDGSLRPFCTKNNLHTYEINGVEQIEVYAEDEWGTFFPSEVFLTESDCLAAAWTLNHQNYVKATNLYNKNREEILSKYIDTNKTPKTLTELCGAAPDSFEKYLKEQEELAKKEDARVEEAITRTGQHRRKFS